MSGSINTSGIISGHIDVILLKIISLGDCYGYTISKTLSQITDGAEIKETTLYSGLRRMESDKLVASYWGDETQGGRRKYYTLTQRGRISLLEHIVKWELTKKIINKILKWEGARYGQAANY